jgi:hypothetical protein
MPWASVGRYYRLARRRNDRSPLRRAMHDNRNNHRAETEVGLRLIQPSRHGDLISNPKIRRTFPASHRRSHAAEALQLGDRGPDTGLGLRLTQLESRGAVVESGGLRSKPSASRAYWFPVAGPRSREALPFCSLGGLGSTPSARSIYLPLRASRRPSAVSAASLFCRLLPLRC